MARTFRIVLIAGFIGLALDPGWKIFIGITLVAVVGILWRRHQKQRVLIIILLGLALGHWYSIVRHRELGTIPTPSDRVASRVGRVLEIRSTPTGLSRINLLLNGSNATDALRTPALVFSPIRSIPIDAQIRVRCRWTSGSCFSRDITVLDGPRQQWSNEVINGIRAIRTTLRSTVIRTMGEPEASVLLGMVFGMGEEIPLRIMRLFQATGTMHLLVFSGFQIVLLVQFLEAIFTTLLFERWLRTIIIASMLVVVLSIVGVTASSVRAVIMGILPLASQLMGRQSAGAHLLIVTAAILLIISPDAVASLSFQLSFTATAGLMIAAKPLSALYNRLRMPRLLSNTAGNATAATMATLPLLFSIGSMLGAWTILPTIIIEMALPLVMITALLIVITGMFSTMISMLFGLIASAAVWWMLGIIEAFAALFQLPIFLSPVSVGISYALLIAGMGWVWKRNI